MTQIIDIHTHFFGPEFFRFLASAAHPERDPEPGFMRLKASGVEVVRATPQEHAARWVAEMDRCGVTRMVTFASLPEEAASVGEGVAASGGRLVPFSLIDPTLPGAEARVERLVAEHGIRGLLLFPAMHHFHPSDGALDPFYRAVERARLPILAHMGVLKIEIRDVLGLPSDFDISFANPVNLVSAARRFPGIRFIIPHFGGGYFRETLMAGSQCGNIAVDTSSSNSWIRLQPGGMTLAQVFDQSLDVFGPERIHFGTDSSVFPRGWRREVFAGQQTALLDLGISTEDQGRIFHGNTEALLRQTEGGTP